MKRVFYFLFLVPVFVFSESLYSPTWGFMLNLPEGYDYVDGDGRDRFSFEGPGGAQFDVVVYNGAYPSMEELVDDVNRRLGNRGDVDFFQYRDKQAAIIELDLGNYSGWGLCVELDNSRPAPMLVALAYANGNDLGLFHLSALDSIIPSYEEQYYPGPIMEYSYPRGERKQVPLFANGISAMVHVNDAEAAQALVEREFIILENYASTPYLREAWIRYYRVIYRDSYDRVVNAASALARNWRSGANSADAQRVFAQRALAFVQGFSYERHPDGSDFVNLVTAVTEGRGDCDSRAMLWAIILSEADIRAAMMVSPQYSHAMGLADISGPGARFDAYETKWLVAETTANVDIGLIAQDQSDPAAWFGIIFE
jgi:hypothetical protein